MAEDVDPELIRGVERRWPGLSVDAEALGEALAALRRDGIPPDGETTGVVALALGCARGDGTALRLFEDAYFGAARLAVERIVGERDVDAVLQALRERLFLATDAGAPRIVHAAGRGDMHKFVRVAAIRLALNRQRGDDRRVRRERAADAGSLRPVLDDPELQFLKSVHIDALKVAFEEAVAGLSSRERNLLRHHLVDHLSIDELASRYGVHRSTAARWLTAARNAVADRTRARLREFLDADTHAAELLALVRSRLDLSITRVLGETEP